MVGFYQAFKDHVAKRHPHCAFLLDKFEATQPSSSVPDLETLMSDLQAVVGLKQGLHSLGADATGVEDQIAVAQELRGYLDAFIVDTCERFDRERAADDYGVLLSLTRWGPLWVFTTNYDRVVEIACERDGKSYSDGFDPAPNQTVADWTGRFDADVRVVKLHGSVNWYVDDPGGALHRLDRGYPLPTHEFRLVRRGQSLKQLMIIPTLEKEALGHPYIQLATTFTDVLQKTRLLVVGGSSLRDRNIREYIRVRLDGLRVLLVGPSADQNKGVFGRDDRTHALPVGFAEFLTLGALPFRNLVEELAGKPAEDISDAEAVDKFISDVSAGIVDEALIASSPHLAQPWRESRQGGIAARARAASELARYPHPAVVRRLTEMIREDRAEAVRVACVSALAHLAGADAASTLGETLLGDTSQDVQIEAALALKHVVLPSVALDWMRRASQRQDVSSTAKMIVDEAMKNLSTITSSVPSESR